MGTYIFRNNKKRNRKRRRKLKGDLRKNPCQLKKKYADFKHLGWDNWVLSPLGFDMGYCEGNCAHNPIPDHLEPTNHAIFQSLYHSKG
jgi:hypothetical protein